MDEVATTGAETQAALHASSALVRASDPRASITSLGGAAMSDPTQHPEAAGLLAWLATMGAKMLPPALGVAVMAAVDKPETHRELLLRLFVALTCSYLFGDLVFDFLRANFDLFKFLDATKRPHTFAIEAVVGGVAYSGLAIVAKYFRKLRAAPDPVAVIADDAKALKP